MKRPQDKQNKGATNDERNTRSTYQQTPSSPPTRSSTAPMTTDGETKIKTPVTSILKISIPKIGFPLWRVVTPEYIWNVLFACHVCIGCLACFACLSGINQY